MRKTKFDDYVFYCTKTNSIWQFCWDYAIGGIESWYAFNGKLSWFPKGSFQEVVPPNWILIDRFPEKTFKCGLIESKRGKTK